MVVSGFDGLAQNTADPVGLCSGFMIAVPVLMMIGAVLLRAAAAWTSKAQVTFDTACLLVLGDGSVWFRRACAEYGRSGWAVQRVYDCSTRLDDDWRGVVACGGSLDIQSPSHI